MGITIISITHFMEETLDADYIYVMHRGKVALQGTPKEIFSRGTELYSLGLWFPQIYHLAYVLREKGLPIPDDVIHADELKAAMENLKKKLYKPKLIAMFNYLKFKKKDIFSYVGFVIMSLYGMANYT